MSLAETQRNFSEFVGHHLLYESSALVSTAIKDGVIRRRSAYEVMQGSEFSSQTIVLFSRYLFEVKPGVFMPKDAINTFSYTDVLSPGTKKIERESTNLRISLWAGKFALEGLDDISPVADGYQAIVQGTMQQLSSFELIGCFVPKPPVRLA